MKDLFAARSARPMLIGDTSGPYDDAGSLFELKLDGERCLAYLDGSETILMNRRGVPLLDRLPELADLHRQVACRSILDGEIITGTGGVDDFERLMARMAHRSRSKIELAAERYPASFVVFDILYRGDEPVTGLPLEMRKALLSETVCENERMPLARTVEASGRAFYDLVLQQGLEGIVGKKKRSLYHPGKRTKDWVKIKNQREDDFVICGYVLAEHVAMLLLGQYSDKGGLVYQGRVTLGLRTEDFKRVRQGRKAAAPPYAQLPPDALRPGETPVWLLPDLVCTVYFMNRPRGGLMRQPHYRRLRPDKAPQEAVASAVGRRDDRGQAFG